MKSWQAQFLAQRDPLPLVHSDDPSQDLIPQRTQRMFQRLRSGLCTVGLYIKHARYQWNWIFHLIGEVSSFCLQVFGGFHCLNLLWNSLLTLIFHQNSRQGFTSSLPPSLHSITRQTHWPLQLSWEKGKRHSIGPYKDIFHAVCYTRLTISAGCRQTQSHDR